MSKFKISSNQFLGFFVDKNNIATLVGAVVVKIEVAVRVTLVLVDAVLLPGFVAAGVVLVLMISLCWLSVAIKTMPAVQVAQNMTNQATML